MRTDPLPYPNRAWAGRHGCAIQVWERTMSHKYHLHQMVRLARFGFSVTRASSSGVYEVTRLMPADQTGEVSYRIKSSGGERAVRESEILAPVSDA